jgi:hypothetical protein
MSESLAINTLTLALAHAVADSVGAEPGEERGAIVLGMRSGIQFVMRQVLNNNTPIRNWQ